MSKEQLNQYYLNTMGIDCWVPRHPPVAEQSVSDAWQTLTQQAINCHACDLCHTRKNVVFGVGNQQAELMIVGEAPGFHEDQQGEPFVGRAGKLLNAMMKSIGLTREQVYIANVIKCRPPENRDPRADEIMQCAAFLRQQILLVQPKIIVAVGRHAAHYLLETATSISKLRKTLHHWGEPKIPVIVSYHPAYLLRNPAEKKQAFADWQQAQSMLV